MRVRKQTRAFTLKEAKLKAANYCAYQERTQNELRERLLDWGLRTDEAEDIIAEMINEGFVNEERYAKSYVSGKFRLKKWGRHKIKYQLKQKGLSDYCIRSGMQEIDADEYWETLLHLAEKKWTKSKDDDPRIRQQKCYRFLANKGFESDLIRLAMHEVNNCV